MRKRIILLLLVTALIVTAAPTTVMAAANRKLDAKDVCYTPQNDYQSGDCILTASKVMIRRASILRGSKKWSSISNRTLRTPATIFGLLLHRFTFEADGLQYKIGMGVFNGADDAIRVRQFQRLVKQHPEGVVVWGNNASRFGMHGVLLVDVRKGEPYVMDSAYNVGSWNKGIMKWSDSSMKNPSKCTQYWYIREVTIAKKAKAPAKGKPLAAASATNVSTESTLAIRDQSIPSKIKQGNGYPVQGTINSNYRIKNVSVKIINSSGKAVIAKSASPNTWSYDLDALDSSIRFGTLSPGTYTYKVSATDEKQTLVFVNASFKVTGKNADPDISIRWATRPSSVNEGDGFTVGGRISSEMTLTNVLVAIVDANGKTAVRAAAEPYSRSYDLSYIDSRVKFGRLSAGKYTYIVKASNSAKTKTLVRKEFKVVPRKSTLSISSYTAPTVIRWKWPFILRGKVTSNCVIKKVTVRVVDSAGKVRISETAKPYDKSFNILTVDYKIKFGTLSKGVYRYQIIATDTSVTKTLVNQKFTVK